MQENQTEKKDEGLIKDSFELILKEFQTLVTFFYLVLIGIGMVFNYYKYEQFGINIFEYADPFDFLIAPFQDKYIIVFALLSALIPYFAYLTESFMKRKYPKIYSRSAFGLDKKSWFNTYRAVLFAIVLVLYTTAAGQYYGEFFQERFKDQSPISVIMLDKSVIKGKLIGKTQDMIFLKVSGKVTAIPVSSAVKVEIE